MSHRRLGRGQEIGAARTHGKAPTVNRRGGGAGPRAAGAGVSQTGGDRLIPGRSGHGAEPADERPAGAGWGREMVLILSVIAGRVSRCEVYMAPQKRLVLRAGFAWKGN